MVYIFYCRASLRVNLNGYFCSPTIHSLQILVLEDSSFFCQIASSSSFALLSLHMLLAPSSSVVLLQTLLLMEFPFVPQGLLSMGVFRSLVRMESFLLPHVSYHYTGILQQPVIWSNCPVGSSYNVEGTFLFLD